MALATTMFLVSAPDAAAQNHKSAPAPKPAAKAPARAPQSSPHATAGRTGSTSRTGAGARSGTAGRPSEGRASVGTVRNRDGGTTTHTARGGEISRAPNGRVTSYRGPNGNEARFGSHGQIREVRGHGMVVSRGPGGMRRTVVERPDHSRFVAYGHGRGYISRPYSYGGHSYYSRAYYRHGGYYRNYYHPYYYHGVYLHGYIPSYYYPAAYYGWAYNPWPAPVPYAWGWAGNPWYGYYGAYFAPYPVYPSAAYWIADYMIAASLSDAYAAGQASVSLNPPFHPDRARLIFASYDPDTGTTSPTMTKEVKDAVSQEIEREIAAQQKAQDPADGSTSSLATLLADGQPHVFVANAALTVTSSGEDCALTEGDVLGLSTPPAPDATTADVRILAGKQTDCAKNSVVSVDLDNLQEMQNHLLASIDSGMAEMKSHPGQGGLPAPPAAVIADTKPAPYAEAAPPADPNGAAELDEQSQQGAQLEQQVAAEAAAPDDAQSSGSGPAAAASEAPAAAPSGPVTIALGMTEAQVVAAKGQPLNKVDFPTKVIYIYSDMKIVFVHGKVSDVK